MRGEPGGAREFLWLFWRPLEAALVSDVLPGLQAPAVGVLALVFCGWVILNGRAMPGPRLES